jgi:biotin/methionine sulfoxide reductase
MSDTDLTLEPRFRPHTSHWGVFSARMKNGRLEVHAYDKDPDPNRLIENFPDALAHRARIARPMARRGWLERGGGLRRSSRP